jgi:hypothetical protein
MPAVLPGIPLALISITLQVLVGAIGIPAAFQQIALHKNAGIKNVVEAITDATGSFPLAIALSIGCIVALVIFQRICDQRDEQIEWSEPPDRPAPRIVFFLSTIYALAAMALLWFFESTIDFIFVIIDSARQTEAQLRLGHMGIAEVAAMISHRLLLSTALSFVLTAVFLSAPFFLLAGEVPEWVRTQSLTFAIVTVGCLILFGVAYHNEITYIISLTQYH